MSGVSGRYATALFDLAAEHKALDQVEQDIGLLEALIEGSEDLVRLMKSPLFGRDAQQAAMSAVLADQAVSDLTRNFVGVIARNGRLGQLDRMAADFRKLLARHRGEVTAEVVSARPLSGAQVDALTRKLKLAVGRDVAIDATVDESLLGGLVVKVGSRMVDSSLKTKLETLKIAMKGVR